MKRLFLSFLLAFVATASVVGCTYIASPEGSTQRAIGSITAQGPITATNVTASGVVAGAGLSSTGNITATSSVVAAVISASDGITITGNNALRQTGSATTWEDLRIDGMITRAGVVAPTDEGGFRGDANTYVRNFVHNQADEVQFAVQMPHSWAEGTGIYPHVHFSPFISSTGDKAAQFILSCYWSDIGAQYPAASTTYTMTQTWNGDKQWYHLLASSGSALSMTGKHLSSVGQCRLWRDNTVTNNLQGKVTFQYFDIHYETDALGSRAALTK